MRHLREISAWQNLYVNRLDIAVYRMDGEAKKARVYHGVNPARLVAILRLWNNEFTGRDCRPFYGRSAIGWVMRFEEGVE